MLRSISAHVSDLCFLFTGHHRSTQATHTHRSTLSALASDLYLQTCTINKSSIDTRKTRQSTIVSNNNKTACCHGSVNFSERQHLLSFFVCRMHTSDLPAGEVLRPIYGTATTGTNKIMSYNGHWKITATITTSGTRVKNNCNSDNIRNTSN